MGLSLWRSSSTLDPGRARTGTRSERFLSLVGGSGLVVFPGEEEQRVSEGGLVVVPARRTDWRLPAPEKWRQFGSPLRNRPRAARPAEAPT
jgi:hypothetical protein